MTLVNKRAFIEYLETEGRDIESICNDVDCFEVFRHLLQNATCDVCGEEVLDKKEFLWWRGNRDIIICADCAFHTLSGLNLDLLVEMGRVVRDRFGNCSSLRYGVLQLLEEIDTLQKEIDNKPNGLGDCFKCEAEYLNIRYNLDQEIKNHKIAFGDSIDKFIDSTKVAEARQKRIIELKKELLDTRQSLTACATEKAEILQCGYARK